VTPDVQLKTQTCYPVTAVQLFFFLQALGTWHRNVQNNKEEELQQQLLTLSVVCKPKFRQRFSSQQ
jgi:hypothetical protein